MVLFDLFVYLGESEIFGQMLQEVYVSGVFVVVIGCGGLLDFVWMGIDGWLYCLGDFEDLCLCVVDFVGDQCKCCVFGEVGCEGVQYCSWVSVCDQFLEYFDEVWILYLLDVCVCVCCIV